MFTALAAGTFAFTLLRGFRSPDDYAKVHWLLDYRHGFVKRGLVGELVSQATRLTSVSVTDRLIVTLSTAVLAVYCAVLAAVVVRIVLRSGWSTGSMLVGLAFLSSPFVVMSAHLNGYYDNIVIVLGVASIVLLLRGWMWAAVVLQVVAVLVQEISMLLVFLPFCLAWLLVNSQRHGRGERPMSVGPLLVPVGAFVAIVVFQEAFLADDFVRSFTARLQTFTFLNPLARAEAANAFDTSFSEYLSTQWRLTGQRVSDPGLYGLVVPSTLAILAYLARAYRVRVVSAETFVALGVVAAPQAMHLIAWDTERIATYSILAAMLVLWIYAEVLPAGEVSPTVSALALAALVANVLMVTPLMSFEVDAFGIVTRLAVLVPLLAGSLYLFLADSRPGPTDLLSVQGVPLARLMRPRRWRGGRSSGTGDVPPARIGGEPVVPRR